MGRGRRDKVDLTVEQRENLEQISRNGYAPAKKILHARILLMCDEGKQAPRKWTDPEIAEALQVHRNTVGRIRQKFLEKGEKPALNRQPRRTSPTAPKMELLKLKSLPYVVRTHHLAEPSGRSDS